MKQFAIKRQAGKDVMQRRKIKKWNCKCFVEMFPKETLINTYSVWLVYKENSHHTSNNKSKCSCWRGNGFLPRKFFAFFHIVFVLSFVLLLDFDRCERNKPELFSKLDSKKCLRVVGQFPSLLICYNFISYQEVDIDSKDWNIYYGCWLESDAFGPNFYNSGLQANTMRYIWYYI